MSLLMDKAETRKEKRIKTITEGGLGEARKVNAWNRENGRVGNLTDYELRMMERAEKGQEDAGGFLQAVVFEFASMQVTALDALLVCAVAAAALLAVRLQRQGSGGPCLPCGTSCLRK